MVEYRSPAREIVTVQLDEAGGRRPAIPSPHSPTPSVTVPCPLVGLMVGLLTLRRRPAVHSRRLYSNMPDPLGRRLGWGLSRLVKAGNHKSGVLDFTSSPIETMRAH